MLGLQFVLLAWLVIIATILQLRSRKCLPIRFALQECNVFLEEILRLILSRVHAQLDITVSLETSTRSQLPVRLQLINHTLDVQLFWTAFHVQPVHFATQLDFPHLVVSVPPVISAPLAVAVLISMLVHRHSFCQQLVPNPKLLVLFVYLALTVLQQVLLLLLLVRKALFVSLDLLNLRDVLSEHTATLRRSSVVLNAPPVLEVCVIANACDKWYFILHRDLLRSCWPSTA